jgi:hypothetical protein
MVELAEIEIRDWRLEISYSETSNFQDFAWKKAVSVARGA